MRNFIYGLVLGVGITAASSGIAATVIGDGYLFSWVVTYNGEVVCYDPWVWSGVLEIEC